MKRLVTLVVIVCCAAALLSACSKNATRPAATVNGKAIPTQALVDELNAIAGNADYLAALEKQAASAKGGAKVQGATPGSFDVAFATSTLRSQIFYVLIHDEVERQRIRADDACATAVRKEVYTSVGFGDAATGEATFAKFSKAYQDTLLQRDTDLLVLQAHLANQACVADDAAKAYYDAHPDEFQQTCGSVLVVADQGAADAAAARLKAGEDFAAVATAVSVDKATAAKGGDFGCKTKSELSTNVIPPFFSTPVGQVSQPASVGSGFVIVKVVSRRQAALEDVRQQAAELAATQASTALQSFVQQSAQSATVTVDPRYGTWNTKTGQIDMPDAAAQTSTGSGPALVPSTSS
ncbi:MAG: peptidyl-prolyl cis-trans isomerase [Acidimicrobiales bacterium]